MASKVDFIHSLKLVLGNMSQMYIQKIHQKIPGSRYFLVNFLRKYTNVYFVINPLLCSLVFYFFKDRIGENE